MIVVIQSLFNESITSPLANGAIEVLKQANLPYLHLKAPGALEIPMLIQWAWKKGQTTGQPIRGAIACGCVVRGETYHFEVVANESARAVTELMLKLEVPITNAILTTYDYEQAFDRAGGKLGNKGAEAAVALVQLLALKNDRSF